MPLRRFWPLVVPLLVSLACSLPLTSTPAPPPTATEAPTAEAHATATPVPSAAAQTGPTATPTPAACGENLACLIQAAQDCQPTEGIYTLQSDMVGVISETVLQFVIQGPTIDGQCAFDVRPLSVSLEYTDEVRQQLHDQGLSDAEIEAQRKSIEDAARESAPSGSCVGQGADLATLFQRWSNGHYALDDWAPFTCTGGTLAQSGDTIVITAEVTLEVTEETATPTNSYPPPQVSFVSTETQSEALIYHIQVDNWEAYPEAWFQPAPDLPPCGYNNEAARAWVLIINADTQGQLYGFCAFSAPKDLQGLWFRWPKDKPPPHIVVDIWDRLEDVHYRSEPLAMPSP